MSNKIENNRSLLGFYTLPRSLLSIMAILVATTANALLNNKPIIPVAPTDSTRCDQLYADYRKLIDELRASEFILNPHDYRSLTE